MEIITTLYKKIRRVADDLENNVFLKDIIYDNQYLILDMNTEDQLYEHGINSLGVEISDYQPYRPLTIAIKAEKGQPTDRVTLRDEGNFHHSFYLEIELEYFKINASDPITPDLVDKYGKMIFGLTQNNILELKNNYIVPELLEKIKNVIYEKY